MSTAIEESTETVADLLEGLGGIDPKRVRLRPAPGTATEADLIEVRGRDDRLYELVDGTLVEKAVGYTESVLAGLILRLIWDFVDPRNLGLVSGPDGTMRLFPGLVRMPDVAFANWDRFPDRRAPKTPVPDLVPDLAVEVLSEGNTRKEMARKLKEYFEAGVRLVWLVDPKKRVVSVYELAGEPTAILGESEILEGGDVLAGFTIRLSDLFAKLDRAG